MVSFFSRCALSAVCCLLLLSCATRKIEVPVREGIGPREMLAERESLTSLESTLHIEFERDGSVMQGDAVLRLNRDSLDLQIYSLGFLVAEVISDGRVTRSNPPIDRSRLLMVIEGLRNSFFWWSVKNPTIKDDHDTYRVSNSWRRLSLDKKTLMPEKQIIELEGGRELTVYYDEPAFMGGIWFPSKMRIELSSQSVSVRIKTLSFNPEQQEH
ncbi:MAG TPA: hypothetical protein VN328_06205 [Thermodesulfovibrionales bacterium]|nr:hypothetical protein [Thermodesulfovibrionales bacterium]